MAQSRRRRRLARPLSLLAVMALSTAACGATGATAIPTKAPATTSAATAGGPVAFASTTFGVPFTMTLPAGWKVADEAADMFTAYLPAAGEGFTAAIDIQLVPVVHVDPCNAEAGTTAAGTTAADLAAWMLAFKPLAATAGAPATIGAAESLVIDEAFAGTPCENAELWPTDGGWLDASEQKRYFVLEVGGKRLVATIATADANFAANVDVAAAVLSTLAFGG